MRFLLSFLKSPSNVSNFLLELCSILINTCKFCHVNVNSVIELNSEGIYEDTDVITQFYCKVMIYFSSFFYLFFFSCSSYLLFTILPTFADIGVAVVYFIVAFNGWFGLLIFLTMALYIGKMILKNELNNEVKFALLSNVF